MGKRTIYIAAVSLLLFCTSAMNCHAEETAMAKENLNIVFAVDHSGSMNEQDVGQMIPKVLQIFTDTMHGENIRIGYLAYNDMIVAQRAPVAVDQEDQRLSLKQTIADTYEYRPDGKLLNKWNSGRKVLSCTYYRDGSLKSRTDVSGKPLYFVYDGNGRLKYLKDDTDTILTEYRYTNAGRIKEIITKDGIITSYDYDEDGNVSRLTIGDGTEEGLLYDAFLLYDLNGNRTKKTGRRLDAAGKQAEMAVSYRYDSMNRLTNEDRNGAGERYAYDLCGNRLLKEQYSGSFVDAAEGYRYNERNQLTERIAAGSLTAYRYDKNGSIVSEEEEGRRSEYRYDLLNRQTYVKTLDGKEQENSYDGEGLRAGLTENGKKTTFLYHNGEILAECDGESAPVRRHIRGIGLSCVQTIQDNAYHSYHQDEQGSTAYITGQGRETENIYQYDAFGNLLEQKEAVTNRILYTGQQYDQETGQYYLRARYYNPVVGRFLQEDTYRGDGLNLYAYCANNPVVYYDPSGHGTQYRDKVPETVDTPGAKATNTVSPKTAQGNQIGGQGGTQDIYRAVSPEEYDDIFATGGFRGKPDGMSLDAKEFGNNFDETLEFANQPINIDKAAIVKVTIPEDVYNQLEHLNLDQAIFKHGTPVVEPDMLDLFNESIINIEHVF